MVQPILSKINLLLKFLLIYVFSTFCIAESTSNEVRMNPEKLHAVIEGYTKDVKINNNVITFTYNEVTLYCVWDASADRMRILSPIARASELEAELIEMALKANYHTVLDARYAIGDDVLYSAFIHPLSSITDEEVESAIRQVATAAQTFGTSFTSGELVFPGNSESQAKKGKSQSM